MLSPEASRWVATLGLVRHPEGGWFRETYRSDAALAAEELPARYGGARRLCTAIYYLLAGDEVSVLHRLPGDELWHHYAGVGVDLHLFTTADADGYRMLRLGNDLAAGRRPQARVPGGCWFGATVAVDDGAATAAVHDRYGLVGCTMAPGYAAADLELADRDRLSARFPAHAELISHLTPSGGRREGEPS